MSEFIKLETPITDLKIFSDVVEETKDLRNIHHKELYEIYDVVIDFIRRKKRILVGGMSIDYALKLKGDKLYDSLKIDYDFYSPEFHKDAYELGDTLAKKYTGISVIGALHVTTMRVRYNFMPVADITYVPKLLFDQMPTITYEGIICIHPKYQMIDQMRSIVNMVQNPPMESLLSDRIEKDIRRFHMLSVYYTFDELASYDPKFMVNKDHVVENMCYGQCIGGVAAALYWINQFTGKGPKGIVAQSGATITLTQPETYPVVLYTDDICTFVNKNSVKLVTKYRRFLDNLPESHLYDADGFKVLAYNSYGDVYYASKLDLPAGDVYIISVFGIMVWLLTKYMFYKDEYLGYLFRELWILLRADFAKDPTKVVFRKPDFYGKCNLTENFILAKKKIVAEKAGETITRDIPKNAYPEADKPIAAECYQFDPSLSEVFQIDGTEF